MYVLGAMRPPHGYCYTTSNLPKIRPLILLEFDGFGTVLQYYTILDMRERVSDCCSKGCIVNLVVISGYTGCDLWLYGS